MMPKPVRNSLVRSQSDKRVATFADTRSASAPIETNAVSSLDVSAALRKRPWLAAAPFLLALLVGVPYALRTSANEYHAEATIYVSPTFFKNLQSDREQVQIPYGTLVNQQILTIRRLDILKEALIRLEGKEIYWRAPGETEAASVARLAAKLEIRPIPDSYEVLIGLSGPKQEWLAPIINTIADTYLEKERSEELLDRSNRFATLTSAKAKIDAALQLKLDQQSKISATLRVANLDKAPPVDDTLLAGARQALEEAKRKRIEAETQIKVMSANAGNGKSVLTTAAEESVANDSGLRTFSNFLLQKTIDLRARIEGLTPEHPLRQSTEKEIAGLNAQITALPRGPVDDASARLMTKLRSDVDRTRMLENEMEKQVLAGTVNVQGVAKQVQQAQGLSEEIERLRKSQGSVTSAMEQAIQDVPPGFLRVFSAAQAPIAPSKSSLDKTLGILAALALIFSIGICVMVDLIDQRIFSPAEVKRAVGFTPVGLLLESAPGTEAYAEEHFWRLVNGIQRAITVQDAKSIVFTPLRFARNPNTLVSDIARALSSCGVKTAILDAKPRRGDERMSVGLSEISVSDEHPSGALQSTHSGVPARIEGGGSKDLARVPGIGREIVDKMKRDYDVVLIDAPSLLLSADMEYLAVISDITMIVVETGEATRRELIQGSNMLRRIGAPNVGVVMSQVRLHRAGRELNQDFKRFSERHVSETTVDLDTNMGGI